MTESEASLRIYLETNFFIKAVEGTDEASQAPKTLIDVLRSGRGVAVTSEITLAELLAPPKRPDALPLHVKRRIYLDLLLWSGLVALIPVSRDVLIETADVRSVARMKLPDAIHMVSAIRANCRYLVSSDTDFKAFPTGMTRVAADADGIETIIRTLAG